MIPEYPLFINGKFKDSRKKRNVSDPSTGETIVNVALADKEDIDESIATARLAFDQGPWRNISLSERKEFLLKVSRGILDKAAELASLETQNTGKPIKESTFMDIPSSAKAFEHMATNLENYLKPEALDISADIRSNLLREPLGVVVLIVPWNYPLLIASWKMSQALAAGNTVVLKPSSLTPLSVLELAKIIHDAGFPPGVVNIINTRGEELGGTLCGDSRVDMVSFTGSNSVGKQILCYTANSVKKLIMELGGKSAGIVFKDADLELAVNGSLCSIFLNQGQMCTAMSRILVEDAVYDRFTSDFVAKAKRIKLGKGSDYETQMGPLISEAQRNKVLGHIQKARASGVKLLCGGKVPSDPALNNGFFLEPTVFGEVSEEADIFKEEVFGPVVCISRFSEKEEALRLANKSDFALAASVWSKDISLAEDMAKRINAGTVWINTYGMFYNDVPYGGFKQSGFGKELGREGFLEYTRLKNVLVDQSKDTKPIVNDWYGL